VGRATDDPAVGAEDRLLAWWAGLGFSCIGREGGSDGSSGDDQDEHDLLAHGTPLTGTHTQKGAGAQEVVRCRDRRRPRADLDPILAKSLQVWE